MGFCERISMAAYFYICFHFILHSFIHSFIHSLREKVMKPGFLKSEATRIRRAVRNNFKNI